jgi:putative tryptophan/tyrosine transport system substrate-binding protein
MATHIQRRELITLLGGAAGWPIAVRAQQLAMPVVGFLSGASPGTFTNPLRAFRQGLTEGGYVEGRNVAIECRWAERRMDVVSELVADLVRRQVTVIAISGSPTALAAKAATTTIPIVFATGSDPVEEGLVASLARPGSNVTGVTTLGVELGSKRLELLHEMVPTATIMALLVNPASPSLAEPTTKAVQAAARSLGLQLHVLKASIEHDFDAVFSDIVQLRAAALIIGNDGLFNIRSERLAALAVRHAVPTIFQYPEFAAAGGLMSYGGSIMDAYRQVGVYTARVLKGEKPADLPVQQSTKVELIINLKTAKALGLTVPLSLIGRADEVIE